MIYANCNICGNKSGYDKESLKGSTWYINGQKIVLCCPCEDDLLRQIARSRGINIKYGDGGEIEDIKIDESIVVNVYYNIDKRKSNYDFDLMREEFEDKLKKLK